MSNTVCLIIGLIVLVIIGTGIYWYKRSRGNKQPHPLESIPEDEIED